MELETVWSGDIHGPSRGLLLCPEGRMPIRPAPDVLPPTQRKAMRAIDHVWALMTEEWRDTAWFHEQTGYSYWSMRKALRALQKEGLIEERAPKPLKYTDHPRREWRRAK